MDQPKNVSKDENLQTTRFLIQRLRKFKSQDGESPFKSKDAESCHPSSPRRGRHMLLSKCKSRSFEDLRSGKCTTERKETPSSCLDINHNLNEKQELKHLPIEGKPRTPKKPIPKPRRKSQDNGSCMDVAEKGVRKNTPVSLPPQKQVYIPVDEVSSNSEISRICHNKGEKEIIESGADNIPHSTYLPANVPENKREIRKHLTLKSPPIRTPVHTKQIIQKPNQEFIEENKYPLSKATDCDKAENVSLLPATPAKQDVTPNMVGADMKHVLSFDGRQDQINAVRKMKKSIHHSKKTMLPLPSPPPTPTDDTKFTKIIPTQESRPPPLPVKETANGNEKSLIGRNKKKALLPLPSPPPPPTDNSKFTKKISKTPLPVKEKANENEKTPYGRNDKCENIVKDSKAFTKDGMSYTNKSMLPLPSASTTLITYDNYLKNIPNYPPPSPPVRDKMGVKLVGKAIESDKIISHSKMHPQKGKSGISYSKKVMLPLPSPPPTPTYNANFMQKNTTSHSSPPPPPVTDKQCIKLALEKERATECETLSGTFFTGIKDKDDNITNHCKVIPKKTGLFGYRRRRPAPPPPTNKILFKQSMQCETETGTGTSTKTSKVQLMSNETPGIENKQLTLSVSEARDHYEIKDTKLRTKTHINSYPLPSKPHMWLKGVIEEETSTDDFVERTAIEQDEMRADSYQHASNVSTCTSNMPKHECKCLYYI